MLLAILTGQCILIARSTRALPHESQLKEEMKSLDGHAKKYNSGKCTMNYSIQWFLISNGYRCSNINLVPLLFHAIQVVKKSICHSNNIQTTRYTTQDKNTYNYRKGLILRLFYQRYQIIARLRLNRNIVLRNICFFFFFFRLFLNFENKLSLVGGFFLASFISIVIYVVFVGDVFVRWKTERKNITPMN